MSQETFGMSGNIFELNFQVSEKKNSGFNIDLLPFITIFGEGPDDTTLKNNMYSVTAFTTVYTYTLLLLLFLISVMQTFII